MTDNNKKYDEVGQSNRAAGLSMEQLLVMFLEQQKETIASNKALAEAILMQRVPFVDPKVIAERKQRAEDRKALVDMELRNRKNARLYCSHLNEGGNSNIKWMQHSNGIILGVCGNCRSEFDASRSREDALLLRANPKAIRNMGRAGDHARKSEPGTIAL
jgi:hypothetical protein